MGLGSEWLYDTQFERDFPYGIPCDTWTTKDGRRIPISEMTTNHIRNCMKIVEGCGGWYYKFKDELEKRIIETRTSSTPTT